MNVFTKKIGMLVLIGTLFTACSSKNRESTQWSASIPNLCNTKPQKICESCTATSIFDKKEKS